MNLRAASAALVFVLVAQAIVCVGILLKAQKRSREKQLSRGDAALAKERSRFTAAHIVDLFGANGDRAQEDYSKAHLTRAGGGAATYFTADMASHMFNGLDGDGDALVTKADLEGWLREQRQAAKAGGFLGTLEVDEVNRTFLPPTKSVEPSILFHKPFLRTATPAHIIERGLGNTWQCLLKAEPFL